ncbi:MAG TPA: complex I NDUFA9 subunit family protein [candidate division Zixibacteria bacterium]|nr:complex I NDUFA9 subunit family protein [candidate division Zixibacteria bacterium]
MDVAVIGATGFVGRHLVPVLEARGHRVRAVSRSGRRLEGWSPEVVQLAGDVETGAGVEAALLGADAVVHLVAIPRERGGRTFERVNVRGTACVVTAARTAGVRRFVHVSALGVTDDRRLRFLSSKWRGEQLVRESPLEWVVLRPSLLFGPGDGFFSLIRTTLTWWSPGIVVIPGDGTTRFQPLAVDDLAHAIECCVVEPGRPGSVIELGGPAYLTYREIVRAVMEVTGKRRLMVNVPVPLLRALTAVTDRVLPVFPVSHDQIGSLRQPNWTDLAAYRRAFGREPRPFDIGYLAV